MPLDSSETRKISKPHNAGAPPPEQEHLPCPRCDSINTKFCYYNNYNFSQPRHFCKSCRRYWTQGGTLRDIPVGGGTRKVAKRSRTAAVTGVNCSAVGAIGSASFVHESQHGPLPATPVLLSVAVNPGYSGQFECGGSGGDGKIGNGNCNPGCGNFTSLLNTQGPGFLALGGFGFGIGPGLEDVGFGFGRTIWPLGVADHAGASVGTNGVLAPGSVGSTWHVDGSENVFVGGGGNGGGGGDCFSWPDLAISTPGNGLIK